MRIKTSELTGAALDWAVQVAKANGVLEPSPNYWLEKWCDPERRYLCESESTNWAQGGPIIEREGIDLWCTLVGQPNHKDVSWRNSHWRAKYHRMGFASKSISDGTTPLIAAMRCYVASELGDEVEVPDELVKGELI